jgi:hypothetical protein
MQIGTMMWWFSFGHRLLHLSNKLYYSNSLWQFSASRVYTFQVPVHGLVSKIGAKIPPCLQSYLSTIMLLEFLLSNFQNFEWIGTMRQNPPTPKLNTMQYIYICG